MIQPAYSGNAAIPATTAADAHNSTCRPTPPRRPHDPPPHARRKYTLQNPANSSTTAATRNTGRHRSNADDTPADDAPSINSTSGSQQHADDNTAAATDPTDAATPRDFPDRPLPQHPIASPYAEQHASPPDALPATYASYAFSDHISPTHPPIVLATPSTSPSSSRVTPSSFARPT